MELQQRTLENRDQFDLDAALDDISLHSLLSDEHHNFGLPELDVSLSQASLERGNAVQPSSQHTHQQTKGQLGDVLQNGTRQQQKQNTPKGHAGRRGRAPADPSQLTEKQLRTREANRKFEERQRQLREETEARLDAMRAELERERAALASARTTNALYDNMLDYKERMIQALQHCKQAHPFSGFVIPSLMVDIIQQEHVLHDFGADNIMRYAAAGYTGHMDGGGRVREAPPFEVVLADWRDIAEQLRGVVEDARAAGAGCAASVDGADTLSSQLSSGQHSVHSAPANPSMSSRPSGNSCAWAAGQGSEQQQVQRAESAHVSSGLAWKGEAAPVPSDATTHSQSTLCPPVRLGHLSYPTESQQVSSLVALASQRGGTAGSLGGTAGSLGMGTAGTTTGGSRALLSGRQQPMVFGPGKGAEDVSQLPSSGEGGPQAGSMGISSSSEVVWLAARGSHHGHLQEQFQRRGMQPQQPQQAVSPVAESRAPGGPLTQELKGGAFAATSCCLRGPSGTGPPAAAAASPKGAGRGEGCGEGQVQGMAVSRLFTRSTSTSFVMLDALDAGMVIREEEEGEVYRFTGAQLRHCFVQLTRVGLLGWQQALLFPQHFRQLLGVRLDTGGMESPSQDTLPHWRNVVRQLRLRPQQMAELASMYRSMCSRRLEPAAQERREVARRLAEAEGVEVATASQQLHAGHTLVMTEVRQALEQAGQQVEAALAGMVSGVFDLMDFPMQTARLVLLSWPYFPQAHLLGLAATLEMEDSSPAPAQQGCTSSASDV